MIEAAAMRPKGPKITIKNEEGLIKFQKPVEY